MTKENSSSMTIRVLTILLLFISIIALVALVFTRSQAQSSQLINQISESTNVPMTLISDEVSYTQPCGGFSQFCHFNKTVYSYTSSTTACPFCKVRLTAGGMSEAVNLVVNFSNLNGIENVILQPNAVVSVVVAEGGTPATSCGVLDGTRCWSKTYVGAAQIQNILQVGDPMSNANTAARITVPLSFPYYAKPDQWTVSYSVSPVDASGNLISNPTLVLSNSMFIDIFPLVAIDVYNTADSSLTLTYQSSGSSIVPGADSDPVSLTIVQKGNVAGSISLGGADWTCTSGQTMPASITHFASSLASFSYSNASAQALVDVFDPFNAATAVQILDFSGATSTPLVVQTSAGNQDGVVSLNATKGYDTVIHVPSGISGTCTSALTHIASQAL